MNEPEVGAPCCWTPAAFTNHTEDSSAILGAAVHVSGRITMVHQAHRWFRVEASFEGGTIRECFKF